MSILQAIEQCILGSPEGSRVEQEGEGCPMEVMV